MGQRRQHDFGNIVSGKVEEVAEDARAGGCHPQVLVTAASTGAEAIAQHAMHHYTMPVDGMKHWADERVQRTPVAPHGDAVVDGHHRVYEIMGQ
jgi:hypothetical protein